MVYVLLLIATGPTFNNPFVSQPLPEVMTKADCEQLVTEMRAAEQWVSNRKAYDPSLYRLYPIPGSPREQPYIDSSVEWACVELKETTE